VLNRTLAPLSAWTWHLLRDAPFRPREETITELLLIELSRNGRGHVLVKKASQGDEVRDGLDWAWALETAAGWVTMLVQAKQIDGVRFGRYQELRKPDARQQANNLVHAAAMASALPVYVFYNGEVPPFGPAGTVVDMGGCCSSPLTREHHCSSPWRCGASPLGVTIAHALDVRDLAIEPPALRQHASQVNGMAMPWECLSCPDRVLTSPVGTSSRRMEVVVARIALGMRGLRDSPIQDDALGWLTPEAPDWAQALLEGDDPLTHEDAPPAAFLVAQTRDADG
jgi:hypothetical protein